jgi:photosystem II stability/assembly factor-like uncharacterized protein
MAMSAYQTGLGINGVSFYGTGDGGASWQKLGSSPITGAWLDQMTFVDPTHGWLLVSLGVATGSEGVSVWGTSDGGHTWQELAKSPIPQQSEASGQLPSGCDKTGLTFKDEKTGWVTAVCAGGSPFLYMTTDGGHLWNRQALPPAPGQTSESLGYSPSVLPPVFPNQTFGLLPVGLSLGSGNVRSLVIYATHDGGRTWTATMPIPSGRAMAAPSADYWIVVVAPRQILSTRDGHQYSQVTSDTDLSQIQQVSFLDPLHGLALVTQPSGGYQLLRSSDGGADWSPVTIGS